MREGSRKQGLDLVKDFVSVTITHPHPTRRIFGLLLGSSTTSLAKTLMGMVSLTRKILD